MANYDFKSLSSYDFECLIRDLLQEELKITFESFKTGRDKGIDFRYSISSTEAIILQAKHYAGSNFNILFNKLKNDELFKIRNNNPTRYILVTSLGLTPPNKDSLKELLGPYCKLTADIYGKDDLNNLLVKFPHIEKRNFKLWLTSQAVLERILHSKVYNQTEQEIDCIEKKLKYYVQNKSFFEAREILDELHYCIIAGIPGIGKTTLSDVLLISYIDRGYEAVKISQDISEAFEVYNRQEKQVFYYDDFLGQTRLADKLNKNEDERILKFIETIKKSKHNRFILSTREYILNQAKETYEKLANSTFDSRKCIINLSNYTKFDRAKILFNHIYFSDLPAEFKNQMLHNKSYNKILEHRNFNPRIVEWMTESIQSIPMEGNNYLGAFLKNLDNPIKVWEHAFTKQISNASRCLLIVLYSLPNEVFIDDLEEVFSIFYNNQSKRHHFQTYHQDFKVALKELESNFIFIENAQFQPIIRFHNPSIRDFLGNYLKKDTELVKLLVESIVYYEQCINLCDFRIATIIEPEMVKIFEKCVSDIWSSLERTYELKECGLILVIHKEAGFEKKFKRRGDVNLEHRLLFALELARALPHSNSSRIINSMLDKLFSNAKQRDYNKFFLLEIIHNFSKGNFNNLPLKDSFFHKTKEFLLNTLKEIEDFEYFTEFIKVAPELFSDQELDNIKNKFIEFYRNDIGYALDSDDPDYISQYAADLEKIGEFFKVGNEEEVGELRTKVDQINSEEPPYDEEYYPGWDEQDTYNDDKEIDSLFDSLEI